MNIPQGAPQENPTSEEPNAFTGLFERFYGPDPANHPMRFSFNQEIVTALLVNPEGLQEITQLTEESREKIKQALNILVPLFKKEPSLTISFGCLPRDFPGALLGAAESLQRLEEGKLKELKPGSFS